MGRLLETNNMQDCTTQSYHSSAAAHPNDHVIHVYIEGALAEKYGTYLRVFGQNTADAMACLAANYPEFYQDTRHFDLCIRQFNNGIEFTDHTFTRTITELRIDPMVAGSGGFGKLLLGAALIGASFIPGVNAIAITASLSLQGILFSVGVGLALSGIGQLLAPKPRENETSYIFSDTKEPAKQGDPIPIPIGKMYFVLNSYLVSGAIDTELVAVNGGGGGKFGK